MASMAVLSLLVLSAAAIAVESLTGPVDGTVVDGCTIQGLHLSESDLELAPDTWDKCEPQEVGQHCCKVSNSKAGCKNYCDARATKCEWTQSQTNICKSEVDARCQLAADP